MKSPHCILDARPAMHHGTGVGTYVEGLLSGYATLRERPELTVFTASWKEVPGPRLTELSDAAGARSVHRKVPVRALNWLWHRHRWPAVETLTGSTSNGDDLVCHSPHPLLLPTRKGKAVVTVHDLHFLENPDETFAEVRRDYPQLLERSLRTADAVICVSEHTRTDLLDHFGNSLADLSRKSFVVPNGVDLEFFRPARTSDGSTTGPYLAVGRIEPRKNPLRLLEAFALAGSDARLLWAGAPANERWRRRMADAIARLGLGDRVEILGYVERSALRELYRSARALLYPSLHEGFGLPILEAMACGCPVLTADRTAMPEVAGDAAVLIDPTSIDSIQMGIETLAEPSHRERLRAAGLERAGSFSWSASALRTVEVYRQA